MCSAIKKVSKLGFQWPVEDPFLFCAHHRDAYPVGNAEKGPVASLKGRSIGQDFDERQEWRMYHGRRIPGFPVHPHRGFETITVVLDGFIDHTDSAGGAGRYGKGDVQWMTAGTGLQHSEMFPLINEDKPNPLELFQIWLNLPSEKKTVKPYFRMLWNESIPKINYSDENGRVTELVVITGSIEGVNAQAPSPDSWASNPENYVSVIRLIMAPQAKYVLKATHKEVIRWIYFHRGKEIAVNGEQLNSGYAAEIIPDCDIELVNTIEEGEILLLQGRPINEPVVQYGPFVMNSQTEIQQTVSEYRRTEFGGWPWPADEYVHDNEPRFAKYADGTIEYPMSSSNPIEK